MDTPPIPKPRSAFLPQSDPIKRPVPLPRTKVPPDSERVSASDILRSISTVSKQITEDVAQKVSSSARSANERIEKSLQDGSKFAKGTLEKTLTTSKALRDSVTKSVIEGTRSAGVKLRRQKKVDGPDEYPQRCVSVPVVDVSLFDNIQFHSPLLEQKRFNNEVIQNNDLPSLHLNASNMDDLSLFSSNSDSNTDTVSNFSYDGRESEANSSIVNLEEQMTYDTPRPNSVISTMSTPEVPERRKKRESTMDVMRQNSLYENWTLPNASQSLSIPLTPTVERPSKSTIYEFDPLNSTTTAQKYAGVSNELILLESFLIGDTYGSIVTTDSVDEGYDYRDCDYFNPPTPPERSDSLLTNEMKPSSPKIKDNNSNWFDNPESENKLVLDEGKPSNSMMQRFSSILKLENVRHKNSKPVAQKVEVVERPPVNAGAVPYFCGTLTRIASAMGEDLFKNSQPRSCVLSDHKLICYADATNTVIKEVYTLDSVYSLQVVLPLSSSTTSNSYCFELMVTAGARCTPRKALFSCASASERRNWAQKIVEHLVQAFPTKYTAEFTRCGWCYLKVRVCDVDVNKLTAGMRCTPRKALFSCASASERRNWAQKIVEHLVQAFPTKYTAEFTRCGWCYLKEGVSGEWRGAWLMLIRRVLVYCTGNDVVSTVDLRKTRCVVSQEADEETKQSCPNDGSGNLLLDCPQATLYLRFPHEKVLKGWRYMIKLAAHNNGSHIHHQQLTKDDIPTIVDKCISFIYAHGSLTEGIYRRAGSTSVLSELLGRFRRDAWSVQLSPGQHSEHDVAGVLKRFFRDLPDALVPQEKHQDLTAALLMKEEDARHAEYRRIMTSLPLVARNTTRKLFAHLHFLTTMAHANKMGAENLAAVWAPTIMPAAVTSNTLQTAWSSKEVIVVRDLIANFEAIWEPTDAEKRREAAVRRVLMTVLGNAVPPPKKAAGDLKAWVYVKDRTSCHQVTLTPNKTSSDVCIELCTKAGLESHLLLLEEVVCSEALRRTVHADEVVLDVVLRWGYWDEDDRRDNYLLVRENKILHEIETLKHNNSVCGELKLATETMKSFKLHMFEIRNNTLCYFKDKQGSHKIEEWKIKDILWYVGFEPKRNPQSRWAITFIPRNNKQKRCKEKPWFGCTIAGAVTEDQVKWMAALMFSEHAEILPTPRLVIT